MFIRCVDVSKFLSIALVSVTILAGGAHAESSCSDLPALRNIVADLEARCSGGGDGTFCRTRGYIGNTATAAVAACSAPGTPYTQAACISDLECSGDVTYCTAYSYIGDDATDAVHNCSASGTPYTYSSCVAALECHGRAHYCKAKGYIGESGEDAVNACSAPGTPYTREACVNDLQCQ